MSALDSAKDNRISDTRASSSMLLTAPSTFSDVDYETSSELLTPRVAVNPQVPRGFSATMRYPAVASQSNSYSADKISEADKRKYALSTKSETCMTQQSQIISDFMTDVVLSEEQYNVGEPNLKLSIKDSLRSIQTIFFPAKSTLTTPKSIKELASTNSFDGFTQSQNAKSETSREGEISQQESLDKEEEESGPVISRVNLSDVKKKIYQDLSDFTNNKLFSKPGEANFHSSNEEFIRNKVRKRESMQRTIGLASQKSFIIRRTFRSSGIKSILRIDSELQPLNLMLSRLLAEFRTMYHKGKLDYVNSNVFNLQSFDLHKKIHRSNANVPKLARRTLANSKSADVTSTPNENFQESINTTNNLLNLKKCAKATSSLHEQVNVNHLLKMKGAHISRSCENHQWYLHHESKADSAQSKAKKLSKRCDAYARRCSREKKSGSHGSRSEKPQRHRRSTSSTAKSSGSEAEKPEDANFTGKLLEEITEMSVRNVEDQLELEEKGASQWRVAEKVDDLLVGDKNFESEIKNESSKLRHSRDEETDKKSSVYVSCSGLISPGEVSAPLNGSFQSSDYNNDYDSFLTDSDATDYIACASYHF